MDAFENENFGESVFKKWDRFFWYKRESWKKAKRIFGYKLDAWHIAKSLMIISFAGCAISMLYNPYPVKTIYNPIFYACVAGIIWIAEFWLVYHKLFKIK